MRAVNPPLHLKAVRRKTPVELVIHLSVAVFDVCVADGAQRVQVEGGVNAFQGIEGPGDQGISHGKSPFSLIPFHPLSEPYPSIGGFDAHHVRTQIGPLSVKAGKGVAESHQAVIVETAEQKAAVFDGRQCLMKGDRVHSPDGPLQALHGF